MTHRIMSSHDTHARRRRKGRAGGDARSREGIALVIAMTAVAAPQGGGSGGSSGNPGTSSASGGSSGSTGGSSGSMGGTSGGMHDSMGSSSGSMQDSSSSHMGGAMGAASGGQLTGDERRFLMEAASAGMLEIQAGNTLVLSAAIDHLVTPRSDRS